MSNAEQQIRAVTTRAFAEFCHGLATGDWQSFIDRLTDDVILWFPLGAFAGENRGKERAAAFFAFVRETFPDGLTVELERTALGEDHAVFEFRDHGTLRGQPYHNRVAISLTMRGEQVCAYREYFGLIGG